MSLQGIPEFYSGRSIFVTGATGFMGKVLIEKLLRSCPDITAIYALVRARKGKDPLTRLNEISNLPLFNVLKEAYPGMVQQKLIPIEGDVMQERLGLNDINYAILTNKVSLVFHVAASVRFNDALTEAVLLNTRGTREVINLALDMKNIQALLHVSTTYCNCDHVEVAEIIYPEHADWRTTINIVEKQDLAILNILATKFLGRMPNTYTFTKSLAEHVIWDHKEKLPVIIFRPSIVISSWCDPVPGWLDNINGPVSMLIGGGKGVLRTCMADPDVVADYMPVDIAIKAIIVAAWHRGVVKQCPGQIPIYNASSISKSISTRELMKLGLDAVKKYPFYEILWTPATPKLTQNKTCFTINVWLKHLLPAILVDTLLKVSDRKPRLWALHRKIYMAILSLSYFTTRAWTFKNVNFLALNKAILLKDKEGFDFNFADINPQDYFQGALIGARKYLLYEDDSLLPAARVKAERLYWLDKALQWLLVMYLLWLLNITVMASSALYKITDALHLI